MDAAPARVSLGRSGLTVSRVVVAGGYGLGARGVERAFEAGVSTFYWGSLRRADFGRGLAAVCARSRDDVGVVVQSYTRVAALMRPSLEAALGRLGIERADVLLLGYWNRPLPARIRDAALALRERGLARALMVSCHQRPLFERFAADPELDAVMVRYNGAHPGAEEDVFPLLGARRPGVVAYTATSWGHLLDPERMPPGERVPTATDCYRFALSRPEVDAVLAGPRDEAELEAALAALHAPALDPDEDARLRRIGAVVRASERNPAPWLFALRRPKRRA